MKNKKVIVPVALIAIALITTATIYFTTQQKPQIEPAPSDGPTSAVQVGEYIATDYPANLPREAVSGVLGSLNAYADNILSPDFDVAAFLDYSYQNQILRFNITETGGEAVLVTKDNAGDFTGEKNPLRATKQLVMYATKSGHTINDLSIKDEISTAGVKDFTAYLDGATTPYTLTDAARAEIIKYCSDMIAENKDTELYVLSDDVIAFVMCERYSEESLLGSFSFLEKGKDGAYRLRTVVDFNC